jgi:ribosomal protein L35
MSLKKMKAKTRKGAVKRIKITNGGDKKLGKLVTGRPNDNHRLIAKQRVRMLKAKRQTTLHASLNKLKAIM